MLLYCSKCNNLVDKIQDENVPRGTFYEKICEKCGKFNRYYVQYRAIIDKKWHKLTNNARPAIMEVQN